MVAGAGGAGAGAAALVPTATTWPTGFLVTWAPVWVRDSSLPSTQTSSKVTLCSPATPLVVVFLVPLARVASSWLVTPNATAWVSLTDFFSTRLIGDGQALGERGLGRRVDAVLRAEGDLELLEGVGDGRAGAGDGLAAAVDVDGDVLGGGDGQRQAGTAERLGPRHRQLRGVGADPELGQGGVDRGGGRPVVGRLAVHGDGQLAAVADDDRVAVVERRVGGRLHDVVLTDGDVLLREEVADGAAEDVHRGGVAIQRQAHGLVVLGHGQGTDGHDGHGRALGGPTQRTRDQGGSKS